MTRHNCQPHWIVAGAGYVGRRLKAELIRRSRRVGSISRTSKPADGDDSSHWRIDLDRPGAATIDSDALTTVIYLIPPQDAADCRIRNFLQQVLTRPPGKLVLISTTGVYGHCDGRWIDESAPTNPQTQRAQRRADVEKFAQQWTAANQVQLVVLRVPAIYGPNRIPVERLRQGLKLPRRASVGYSNRIHVDDLVRICMAAADSNVSGIFNVSDGMPLRMIDYLNLVAELWHLPPVRETDDPAELAAISEGMRSYIRESRKIDNKKMLAELGVELAYPNPRDGLLSCRE